MEKDRPTIYVRESCSQCRKILGYLDDRRVAYETVAVENGSEAETELQKLTGQTHTPTLLFRREILRQPDIPKLNSFLDRFKLDSRPGDR